MELIKPDEIAKIAIVDFIKAQIGADKLQLITESLLSDELPKKVRNDIIGECNILICIPTKDDVIVYKVKQGAISLEIKNEEDVVETHTIKGLLKRIVKEFIS